jgi:hypothetical protein
LETYQKITTSSEGRTSPLQSSNYESAVTRVTQFRHRKNSALKPAEASTILQLGSDVLSQVAQEWQQRQKQSDQTSL